MPAITIENVPEYLHHRLKEEAARHRHTISDEAVAALRKALPEPKPIVPPEPVQGSFPITQEWLDRAIREGRE